MAEDNLAQEIEQLEQKRDELKKALNKANRRTLRKWLLTAPLVGCCAIFLAAENLKSAIIAPVFILIIVVGGAINLWLVKRRSTVRAELKRIEATLKKLRSESRLST